VILDSRDESIYDIRTKTPGPAGALPLTPEIMRSYSSGDLFGWTMDAAMGWDPSQLGRLSFPPKGLGEVRPYVGERSFKLDSEYEEGAGEESGYTIIGGDEIEVLPEETDGTDDDNGSDEE